MSVQDFITELEKEKSIVLTSLLKQDKKTPIDQLKFSIKNYVFDSKIYVSIKDVKIKLKMISTEHEIDDVNADVHSTIDDFLKKVKD